MLFLIETSNAKRPPSPTIKLSKKKKKSGHNQTYMTGNNVQREIECSFKPYGEFSISVGFPHRIFPG